MKPSATSTLVLFIAVLIALLSQPAPTEAGKANDYYLNPGARFTVVCTGGSTMMYGITLDHNGNPIGVKGVCVPANTTAPTDWNIGHASYR